jgi:hypothetical protein
VDFESFCQDTGQDLNAQQACVGIQPINLPLKNPEFLAPGFEITKLNDNIL